MQRDSVLGLAVQPRADSRKLLFSPGQSLNSLRLSTTLMGNAVKDPMSVLVCDSGTTE